MSEQSQREGELFEKCLELPQKKRGRFLKTTCGDDAHLRERIDRLLQAHEKSQYFLESPPDSDSKNVADELRRIAPADECAGDQIGRYRLIELIGEGAHGSVWLAEQTIDIKRQVALKILKLGMDTKEFLARFEAEKQVLALLDHPNIAKVFDAGATTRGRPYFVLELIKGTPLLKHADKLKLTIEQRLGMFVQICQAIHHAHQNNIIHRDLKPSNILIAETESGGIPKIIDFGIAKSSGGRSVDETQLTVLRSFIGTPVYSSPEQLEGGINEIDFRSDIYSLGCLLYELLTSHTPFECKDFPKQGLGKFKRLVCEKGPENLSQKFERLSEEEQTANSELRRESPEKIVSLFRQGLDPIVLKCLEKDPNRRYQSAIDLVTDLKRFLEGQTLSTKTTTSSFRIDERTTNRNKTYLRWVLPTFAVITLAALYIFSQFSNTKDSLRPTIGQSHSQTISADVSTTESPEELLNETMRQVHIFTYLGRTEEADLFLDRAFTMDPTNPRINWKMLDRHDRNEDWVKASTLLRHNLKITEDDGSNWRNKKHGSHSYWLWRAAQTNFFQSGDIDTWISEFKKIPGFSSSLDGELWLSLIQRDLETALRILDRGLEEPTFPFTLTNLYVRQDRRGFTVEPFSMLKALILFELGESEKSLSLLAETEKKIEKLTAGDPTDSAFPALLALCHALEGNESKFEKLVSKIRTMNEAIDWQYRRELECELKIACGYLILGKDEMAIQTLLAAQDSHSRTNLARELRLWFVFDKLRSNPEFLELVDTN